ncbi:MAG: Mrp/NBP35 family ATP-binding protein [Bdellovibrionales bacterium]|nr:Mrp/NBP35 family ATP-binding protein [Bdellovibrionales bacterium]
MAQNPFDNQQVVPGIKKIIVVGSGKGGVGKSTVSTNLALALKKLGFKVGLLDGDLYGPSVPRMFGALHQRPAVTADQKIIPIERYGLKLMSMGFLVEEDNALIWRGPMLFKAIDQFFKDVQWGELDYLVIDLPPGTGDVPLTMAQKVPISGAVTVCTPQNLALIDAKKAIDMFRKMEVPMVGVVENMAYMLAPGSSEKIQLFPKGELDSYLEKEQIPKVTQVPFNTHVSIASESGIPTMESYPDSEEGASFLSLAKAVVEKVPVS